MFWRVEGGGGGNKRRKTTRLFLTGGRRESASVIPRLTTEEIKYKMRHGAYT